MTFPVPRFEPEVIAAGARHFRGDTEKVATTSFGRIDLDGVEIRSRYGKADEIDLMGAMVTAVSRANRRLIRSIFCDSKASHSFEIHLTACGRHVAQAVADTMAAVCIRLCGGHNDILVRAGTGTEVTLDAAWSVGE